MNIIFSEYCGLGNSVLLSASFNELKYNTTHNLSLIGNDKFSGVTVNEFNQNLDEKVNLSKMNIKIFFRLISLLKKCDYLVIPAHSNPSTFFLTMTYIFFKKKIIHSHNLYKNMHFIKKLFLRLILFFKKIEFIEVEYLNDLHEIEINKMFINKICTFDKQKKKISMLNYFSHPGDESCMEKFALINKKYIVLQPFCANGTETLKVWPFENFKELTEMVLNEYNDLNIVLVGDGGDQKNFTRFISDPKIINIISKTKINELITILKNASFIVCHDSSILHLSDSMNLKNISLFGPTNFNKNKPNNLNSFYIRKKIMKEIYPLEVFGIIKKNISN